MASSGWLIVAVVLFVLCVVSAMDYEATVGDDCALVEYYRLRGITVR